MRKILFFVILNFIAYSRVAAQQAEIYIFRPKALSSAALNIQIFMDDKKIGQLTYGERLVYITSDFGEHIVKFKIVNAHNEVKLNLEPYGAYFIETNMVVTRLKAEQYVGAAGRQLFEDETKYRKEREIIYIKASENLTANEESKNPKAEEPELKPVINPVSNAKEITAMNQTRIALVIGNSDYENAGMLANPLNDAEDMEEALKDLGFEVTLVKNAGMAKLKSVIEDFGLKLSNYDIGLFYYAGHGVQSKGYNYFIPVDAELKSEAQVEFNCVRTVRLLSLMEAATNSTNIIILDAFRNNPFERSWSRSASGGGLAFMDAPSGSLIAYASSPGRTASDGYGRNGLYTSALLQYIKEPGLSIEQMFKKVRETVSKKSGEAQVPWESTSLVGNFYFAPGGEN
ncbi:MAG TPA: caspase family protein [Bacteroidales bacterium]|nr:caspase family protein [Bacteroidales bacterium]